MLGILQHFFFLIYVSFPLILWIVKNNVGKEE
jgi:hypothetical protein